MKFEEKIFKIDGLDYAVRIHGNGKPLFALHGFSESSQTWDGLEIPGFQIFAIDLIGHGHSSKPTELDAYQLDSILKALKILLTTLSAGNSFSLLGYSMGGRLAVRFALAYPELPMDHLILESTGPGLSSAIDRKKRRLSDEKLAQNILDKGSLWFAEFWGSLPLFNSQKNLPLTVQKEIFERRAANLPHALAHTLRATGQGELDYVGDKIQHIMPDILYITGSLDEKYTQIGQHIFAPQKNTRQIIALKAGHNVHLEQAEFYNNILNQYLHNNAWYNE